MFPDRERRAGGGWLRGLEGKVKSVDLKEALWLQWTIVVLKACFSSLGILAGQGHRTGWLPGETRSP